MLSTESLSALEPQRSRYLALRERNNGNEALGVRTSTRELSSLTCAWRGNKRTYLSVRNSTCLRERVTGTVVHAQVTGSKLPFRNSPRSRAQMLIETAPSQRGLEASSMGLLPFHMN